MKLCYFEGKGASPIHVSHIRQELMCEFVSLSIGGHFIGAADEVALLAASGEVTGRYVEISWRSPEQWTVREMSKQFSPSWELVADLSLIANPSFQQIAYGAR